MALGSITSLKSDAQAGIVNYHGSDDEPYPDFTLAANSPESYRGAAFVLNQHTRVDSLISAGEITLIPDGTEVEVLDGTSTPTAYVQIIYDGARWYTIKAFLTPTENSLTR